LRYSVTRGGGWRWFCVMAQEEITENHKEAELSNPTARSKLKRQSTKPKYFDDYDCTVKGKIK